MPLIEKKIQMYLGEAERSIYVPDLYALFKNLDTFYDKKWETYEKAQKNEVKKLKEELEAKEKAFDANVEKLEQDKHNLILERDKLKDNITDLKDFIDKQELNHKEVLKGSLALFNKQQQRIVELLTLLKEQKDKNQENLDYQQHLNEEIQRLGQEKDQLNNTINTLTTEINAPAPPIPTTTSVETQTDNTWITEMETELTNLRNKTAKQTQDINTANQNLYSLIKSIASIYRRFEEYIEIKKYKVVAKLDNTDGYEEEDKKARIRFITFDGITITLRGQKKYWVALGLWDKAEFRTGKEIDSSDYSFFACKEFRNLTLDSGTSRNITLSIQNVFELNCFINQTNYEIIKEKPLLTDKEKELTEWKTVNFNDLEANTYVINSRIEKYEVYENQTWQSFSAYCNTELAGQTSWGAVGRNGSVKFYSVSLETTPINRPPKTYIKIKVLCYPYNSSNTNDFFTFHVNSQYTHTTFEDLFTSSFNDYRVDSWGSDNFRDNLINFNSVDGIGNNLWKSTFEILLKKWREKLFKQHWGGIRPEFEDLRKRIVRNYQTLLKSAENKKELIQKQTELDLATKTKLEMEKLLSIYRRSSVLRLDLNFSNIGSFGLKRDEAIKFLDQHSNLSKLFLNVYNPIVSEQVFDLDWLGAPTFPKFSAYSFVVVKGNISKIGEPNKEGFHYNNIKDANFSNLPSEDIEKNIFEHAIKNSPMNVVDTSRNENTIYLLNTSTEVYLREFSYFYKKDVLVPSQDKLSWSYVENNIQVSEFFVGATNSPIGRWQWTSKNNLNFIGFVLTRKAIEKIPRQKMRQIILDLNEEKIKRLIIKSYSDVKIFPYPSRGKFVNEEGDMKHVSMIAVPELANCHYLSINGDFDII